MQRGGPRGIAAPGHDPAECDRDEERDEGEDRQRPRRRVREPREQDVRDEQRQRDERDPPVRRPELEHGAHDDEPDGRGARSDRQPEEDARRHGDPRR